MYGKTTGLSNEPARRSSDFDSCQFTLIRMAYKVSISARSNVTFDISLHEVCVLVGGRAYDTS